MSFIIPLLFILGATGTATVLSRRRFEQLLPVVLMASALMLYLSGLTGSLLPGLWAVIGWACLLPVCLLVYFLKRRALFNDALTRLLTPGLGIFLLLYVAVFLLDYRRGLTWWDEYSHWAPMAKETFRLNAFYCSTGSALTMHADYPPVVTLFEYLWCKLSGGYDVTFLYRGLHLLSFSLFCPALSGLEWLAGKERMPRVRTAVQIVLAAVAIVVGCGLVPMECNFYTSIFNDPILGLLLAFCLGTILFGKTGSAYQLVSLCVGLVFITLTKQIAVFFVALSVAFFLLIALMEHRRKDTLPRIARPELWRSLFSTLLLVVVPALFFLSWRVVLRANGITAGLEASAIDWRQLPGILTDQSGELFQRLAAINFKAAFFTRALGTQPINLSAFQLLFLFLAVFLLFGLYARRKETGIAPQRFSCLAAVAVLGGFAYAGLLLLTYLYHFGAYEGPRLASYERYIGTYILALAGLTVMLILRQFTHWQKTLGGKASVWMLIAVCGLIVCMPPSQCDGLSPSLQAYSLSRDYTEDYSTLRSSTGEDASILIVAQGDKGLAGYILRYETLPRTVDFISLGQPKYDGDVWTENLRLDAFAARLKGYDYLYLYRTDSEFSTLYGALFPSQTTVMDKQLYAVVQTSQGIVLQAR